MDKISEIKLSDAQLAMLDVFALVFPKRVAHTPQLGSVRTWRWLIAQRLIIGDRLSVRGRKVLQRHAVRPLIRSQLRS